MRKGVSAQLSGYRCRWLGVLRRGVVVGRCQLHRGL